jgi:predicted NBD/HSP70 family sugar kinase
LKKLNKSYVRALTIAEEWFGIGVDTDSFAIVTIGTGIGCGLYLNGDVVEGRWRPPRSSARAGGVVA